MTCGNSIDPINDNLRISIDVDAGAILVQKTVPIEHGDTEETLQERIKTVEREAFPEALKLLANGHVYLNTTTNRLVWVK